MRLYGYEYYEMLLVYVDVIIIIYHLGDQVAKKTGDFYNIKEGSQGQPMHYLGVETEKIQTKDEREIWMTSSRYYITNDIDNAEGLLLEDGKFEVLNYNDRKPFPSNYRQGLGVTE